MCDCCSRRTVDRLLTSTFGSIYQGGSRFLRAGAPGRVGHRALFWRFPTSSLSAFALGIMDPSAGRAPNGAIAPGDQVKSPFKWTASSRLKRLLRVGDLGRPLRSRCVSTAYSAANVAHQASVQRASRAAKSLDLEGCGDVTSKTEPEACARGSEAAPQPLLSIRVGSPLTQVKWHCSA
jgi:hypothetical protein